MPLAVSNVRLGYGLIAAASLLFTLNAGVSRVVMRSGISPGGFTSIRITGAAAFFLLVALMFKRDALRPPSGAAWLMIVVYGVIGVAALQVTVNAAIDRLPLGVALLIEHMAPVLVVLWIRFGRGEPVRHRMWGALGLSFVGLALVARIWSGLSLDGWGLVMALLAALSFAIYFLLGEHHVGFDDPLRIILWSFVVAAIVINASQPFWDVAVFGTDAPMLGRLSSLTASVPLLFLWVILLGTVAPFFAQLVALRHLPVAVVSIVAMLEPVGAAVLGWTWFGEQLAFVQMVGGVLVVGGIFLAQSARTRQLLAITDIPSGTAEG